MFKDYLLQAMNQKNIVSLYTNDEDTEKFSLGFVQGVSNDYVLLASITPYGFYDGYIIKNYNDIYRVESNDKYGESKKKLYNLRSQNHAIIENKTDNLILCILEYALINHLVVSVELHDSGNNDLQGFVSNIEDGKIWIDQLDPYGQSDGKGIALIEDITWVACDAEDEQAIKLLAENQ